MRIYYSLGVSIVAILLASTAMGQDFVCHPFEGVARDVVIDDASGSVFVAVYDRNEIWQMDVRTGERIAAIAVERGPVALALSQDGTILACACYLANQVSLVRVGEHTSYATVACSGAPSSVAALPNSGFAVACSLAGKVLLINQADGAITGTLTMRGAVSKMIAATERYVAAAVVEPAAIEVWTHGGEEKKAIPLEAPATGLVALANNRVAVSSGGKVVLLNLDRGVKEAVWDKPLLVLRAGNDRVYGLADSCIKVLDGAGKEVESWNLPESATTFAVNADRAALINPHTRALWIRSDKTEPVVAALPAPATEDSDLDVVDAAAASASPTPTPTPEAPTENAVAAQAEPVQEAVDTPAAPAPQPANEPMPAASQESAPAPASVPQLAEAASPAAKPEAVASQTAGNASVSAIESPSMPTTFRRMPLGGVKPSAPEPKRGKPSPFLGQETPKRSLFDALEQPQMDQAAGGFEAVDWKQPMRDLKFDEGGGSLKGDEFKAHGNVRLHLDTLDFAAENFLYNSETGYMHADDNVRIVQGESWLTADSLSYSVPAEAEMPQPSLLETDLDEQAREKRRLSMGAVDVDNLHLQEPARKLEASKLTYDFAKQSGEVYQARGFSGMYYFSADRVEVLGPGSLNADDVWITTCDHDPPHYRIRLKHLEVRDGQITLGKSAMLQMGGAGTPVYWPTWRFRGSGQTMDFDSGHRAAIGYFVNVGQEFPVTEDISLGFRFLPTTREGVGVGLDADYDFMESPAEPLFRGKGTLHTLYTTKDRGYVEWYHQHDVTEDMRLLIQAEQWGDQDFYKDFFYEQYQNRTQPRTFANLTLTQPDYIASATVAGDTHGFTRSTERLPEVAYHLLERPLTENLYFTFDTVDGFNQRDPNGIHAFRTSNVARLSGNLDLHEALSVTPFAEVEGTWYSEQREAEDSAFRLSNTVGTTLQTRLHKAYDGSMGFSGFKHLIVPSITYSYRPEPSMEIDEVPRFDALDNVYGRSRVESKIDSIVFGRDAESGETWQVARLTLYQGHDFWNERRKSNDSEVEIDIRPRPHVGVQLFGEDHQIKHDYNLMETKPFQRAYMRLYEELMGRQPDVEAAYQYDYQYSDYSRVLSYVYYDNTPWAGNVNARLGFAYTETRDNVFNREILYGAGYRLSEGWAVSFEHRYDLERDNLARQEYELRRRLHCWEMGLTFTDRESGWDVGVEFNILAFPGTKVKF